MCCALGRLSLKKQTRGVGMGFNRFGLGFGRRSGSGLPGFVTTSAPVMSRSGAIVNYTAGVYSPVPTGVLTTFYIDDVAQAPGSITFPYTLTAGSRMRATELPSSVGYAGTPVPSNEVFYPLPNDIDDANWSATEAVSDVDTRKTYVQVVGANRSGFELHAVRASLANLSTPAPSAAFLSAASRLTDDGLGNLVWLSGGLTALGQVQNARLVEVELVVGVPDYNMGRWCSSVDSFTASNTPAMPTGVTVTTGSTEGAINATFTIAGDGRGRAISAPYASINGGALFALTPSGGSTGLRIFTALGTDPVNVSFVWRNANGDSVATTDVSVTPGVGAIVSRPAETVTGGALTLSGAGRRKPRDSAGVEYDLLATAPSLVSGSLGGRTAVISDAGLAFTGAAGWPAGAVLRCTHSTGTVDMTIASEANTYSVASVAEMEAVNALGVATLSGKRMRLRRGEYPCAGASWMVNKAFTSEFIICADDDDAYIVAANTSHQRVKIIGRVGLAACSINGAQNLTFEGVTVEGRFNRRTNGTGDYVLDFTGGGVNNLVYRRCWVKGDNDQIGAGASFRGLVGSGNPQFDGAGITVDDCLLSDGWRMMNLSGPGVKTVRNNRFERFTLDVAVVGGNGAFTYTDNIALWPEVDPSNISFNNGYVSIRSEIDGNVDHKAGLIHFRFMPMSTTGTQRLFGFGAAGGASTAYLNQVTDKLSFVALAPGGATVFTMTSLTALALNVFTNVLISINTDGTSVMHIWQEGGAQGVSPTVETVSATAAGQLIDWTGGGMSIGGIDNNSTVAPGSPALYTVSRLAFWGGISPDITSPAVRANFYDPTILGLHQAAASVAAYGTPLIDAYGTKPEWIAGAGLNKGSASQRFNKRTAISTSLDIGHVDFRQGVSNTETTVYGNIASPSDWVVERNINYAGRTDGVSLFGGGQGDFFEDIRAFGAYINTRVRNNLYLSASNIGNAIANPKGARVWHNTAVALPEMFDPGATFEISLPKFYTSLHDPVGDGWKLTVDGKTGTFAVGQTVTAASGKQGRIFHIISQDATTAVMYLRSSGTGYSYLITSTHFLDNEAITAPGVTATVNMAGGIMPQERPGMVGNSYQGFGNIARDVADNSGGAMADYRASNNVIYGGANDATLVAAYAAIFNGSGVVGQEFALSQITSIDAAKAMFATRADLRNAYEVKVGWDAYWNLPTPYDGVANAFTVAAVSGVPFSSAAASAIIAPTGLTATGVAAFAEDAVTRAPVSCRLLNASDVVLRDWTTNHLLVLPTQKVQVQRVTGPNPLITQNTTVFIGDKSANWAVTTQDVVTVFSDTFTSDTTAAWTQSIATREWNAGTTSLQLRGSTASFPLAFCVITDPNIVIGGVYRVQMSVRALESVGQFSLSIGRTGTNGAYLNDSRKVGTGPQVMNLQTYDTTFTLATAAEIRLGIQSRDGTGTGLRWNVEDILITRVS